jgi:diguanylate cyclase
LAQADKRLPSLATPEEIGIIVKFLIAENARMRYEAADLKTRLQASKAQIERLHSTPAEAQAIGLRDPLTQLDNRRGFDANLAKATGRAQALGSALCLVMGDIDNFKKVNVILPGAEFEDAKELTERLGSQLETKKRAVNKSGEEIGKITASFGIVQLSVGADAQRLVQRADAKRGRVGRPQPRGCRRTFRCS